MTMTLSTSPGISQRTLTYAERVMLSHAKPVIVLGKLGLTKSMPKNKGVNIKFRRPIPFTAATTPLVEGVTPTATQFRYEDVSGQLKQYGMVVSFTDVIEDTHEDPVVNDLARMSGENIGRTVEALDYGILRAGTNVFYQNGTARTDVNTKITLGKLRAVSSALRRQKAMKITRVQDSSPNFGDRAVEAAYVAVCHTDLEPDIRDLPGFKVPAEYGTRSLISEYEIGSVENFRFIASPDLEPFADAGGAAGSMISTSGTSADVYPVLIFGKEAFGNVGLGGKAAESVEPTIIRPGVKDKSDPLGQRGLAGWKTWHLTVILNQMWMARLEVAATQL